MSSPARRIADLEVIARSRQPEAVPVRCFFRQELFQARVNYGNQSPDVVLKDIEHVERIIRVYEEVRREHGLDLIDLAIAISRHSFPGHVQTPPAIASLIVGAYWAWDDERHGEPYAWSHIRKHADFEGLIANRLAAGDTSATA